MKIQKSVKIITILGQISHFESSLPSHPRPHCWLGSLSRWLRGGHWGGAAGRWSGRPRGAPPPSRSTCRPRCNLQFHPARGKRLIIVLQDKDEALPTGWMKKRQFRSTLSEGVELMTGLDWYNVAPIFLWEKNVTNFSDYFSENSEICQNYRHSRWLNFQKIIRFHKIFTKSGSVLREWILKVREVKSEMKIWFTHFEKWKVKWKSVSLISRMKSEMKMPWDREWKVKWKCLEIEIKKWNVNKILENSRETRLSQVTEKWWQKETKIGRNFCHQNWWYFRHLKTHQFLQITKIFTKIGDKKNQNRKELLSPELVIFLSLKNSPILSNHQNVHQN